MRIVFWASSAAMALCICPKAQAAPPDTPLDTALMPELALPQATPPATVSLGPVFSYSVTAASDYIFRGVSQTENRPAIFGATRVTDDQFYVGIGIENVDFHNSTAAEYDLSAGWSPLVAGNKFDFGVVRYGYIGEPDHTHIDTVEYKVAVSRDIGPVTLGGVVYYSDNFFGSGHDGIYYAGRVTYRVIKSLSVSGALGRQTVGEGIGHTTWNTGLDYSLTKNILLDLRYYDTNVHNLGDNYGSHYVAALKLSF